ncbi:class I tRNA ligase family protein, partial [Candidatus Micrarchaeota archaeon]|nr:class I tRNA ligase family protein [Candidatus Micrarchaeota archaeon]
MSEYENIDVKWQKIWDKKEIFQPKVKKGRKKKYLTAAFPYPNSPQHIGHGRTYTTADIYARYLRLKGYNVLFPMAFHVTGTPILAMAKRIAEKDESVLSVFENIYHIDRKTAESLTDPRELVTYFSKEIEEGMKEMGYSIDWRRKFYSFDLHFNKFIQWQFRKLKEKGYIEQGEYPIAWCPKDNNAMSAHDTRGDTDPELEEVTGVKFAFEDGFLITSTYRPETVFAVTNIWINPDSIYFKSKMKGETIFIEANSFENLKLQLGLEKISETKGNYFTGKTAKNLSNGEIIPIYPAPFVKEGEGTGIVMSVPAHAPYDYVALRDLGKLQEIKISKVLETDKYSGIPAKMVVEQMGVENQKDPKLEDATKELYSYEAHHGKMTYGKYQGMPVFDAKQKVQDDLVAEGKAISFSIIANSPVYCRCGAKVVVNVVKDQWFIDYGIEEWKKKTFECLNEVKIIPEKVRNEYNYTVNWLKKRPCTRGSGLGTPFPFDENKIVDP